MPDPWGAFYSNDDMDDDIEPKMQGDAEGERAVRGILLGAFWGGIIWVVGFMVWWAWIS